MPYRVPDAVHEPLYAVVPYFNPWRWKSREKHTFRAIQHFVDAGAVVYLIEAAFGERDFAFSQDVFKYMAVTHPPVENHDPALCAQKYIGIRTRHELWLKENLINLAVQQLPPGWKYVCWLDSDVHFVRPNWVGETVHKLQHYDFVQMFSHARDVGPNYEILPEDHPHADGVGFFHAFNEGVLDQKITRHGYHGPHKVWAGLAWAARRSAWDAVGGLIDCAIWGGGDWHMAHALVGRRQAMVRTDLHPNYIGHVNAWADRCDRHIRRNIGIVGGSILHYWHGPKVSRKYNEKHKILASCGFDPTRHLKRDAHGMWQLHDDGSEAYVKLRDSFRRIALERNEDANEV